MSNVLKERVQVIASQVAQLRASAQQKHQEIMAAIDSIENNLATTLVDQQALDLQSVAPEFQQKIKDHPIGTYEKGVSEVSGQVNFDEIPESSPKATDN